MIIAPQSLQEQVRKYLSQSIALELCDFDVIPSAELPALGSRIAWSTCLLIRNFNAEHRAGIKVRAQVFIKLIDGIPFQFEIRGMGFSPQHLEDQGQPPL